MKTAISLPDADFARFERTAAALGLNRSEFFRRAAERFADEVENGSGLTALANAALQRAHEGHDDMEPVVDAALHTVSDNTEW